METFFIILSALSVLYFIVIAAYSGIGTSLIWVWLLFAAVFALMSFFWTHTKKHRGELPKRFPVAVFTTFLAGAAVFLVIMVPVLRYAGTPAEQGCSYAVVLGARVYSNKLSATLTKRLDRAYAYYLENPNTIFILSGGQGRDEPVPEAMAMYNYLYRKGVPDKNMRVEIFSENTVENLRFSENQIDADKRAGYRSVYPEKMRTGIITSDFHMFRAIGIAKQQGYINPTPITAPSDPVLFLHLCVRECAAILKDHILGNLSLRDMLM